MSRFPCPTCGHEVTSTDEACANCGLPLREHRPKTRAPWLKILGLVALVGGVVGVFVAPAMAFAALMIAGGLAFIVGLALD